VGSGRRAAAVVREVETGRGMPDCRRAGVAIDAEVIGTGVEAPIPIPAGPLAGSQPDSESAKWSIKNLSSALCLRIGSRRDVDHSL
jgi:hypothetical protein